MTKKKGYIPVNTLIETKFERIPFTGEIQAAIGNPEAYGHWYIDGESGQGKSSAVATLIKEIVRLIPGLFIWNDIEEGMSADLQSLAIEQKLNELPSGRFGFMNKASMSEVEELLDRKKRPVRGVIINSIQYTGLRKDTFRKLCRKYPKKLFIWIGHVNAKGQPDGAVAVAIKRHASVKARVEGYKLTAVSRGFKNLQPLQLWEKGNMEFTQSISE